MSHSPLVTVVTPSYNRPDRVRDAVESVDAQTYADIEYVVVDDHSRTPVREVLAASGLLSDLSCELVVERHVENRGATAARNTGIEMANGEYIAFLDDDDEWYPEKIARQVDEALSTGAGVVYTGVEQVADSDTFATHVPTVCGDITADLLSGVPIKSTSTVLVRSDVFEEVGGFDPRLKNHQDWEFYIRASTATEFEGVEDVLVTRHHHDTQISGDYRGKRDVSVPLLKHKHGPLAERYGLRDEFYATLERTLGATAIEAGEYTSARRHYLRALRLSPSTDCLIRLVALSAGRFSYESARILRRTIA